MPVIRISDATFKRLQQYAVPLRSTPDAVIASLLDAADDGDILVIPVPPR